MAKSKPINGPIVRGSKGQQVESAQQAANKRFAHFKINKRISEDGVAGPNTMRALVEVATAMGAVGKNRKALKKGVITEDVQKLVRKRRKKRINEVLATRARVRYRRKLRKKYKKPKSGAGSWGGSKSIIVNEVRPVAEKYRAPRTSSKRGINHWATIQNPGSDHSALALTAFADDYGTYSGKNLAYAIANALGISGYTTGNYNSYYIYRNNRRFRVQILWEVSGHYDHVHVGIRRA